MVRKFLSFVICYLLFVTLFTASSFAVSVYPNPWVPDSNKTDGAGQQIHGTLAGGINFTGLSTDGGTIFIYNSTGELVIKLKWNPGEISKNWNGRNARHEYVASGVYLWVIKDGGTKSGKIVVVR
ncbi:MAG: hypothetical protein FWD54_05250 [Endomicrobia bacterium]|nr:hypothetical protein [Endomicrobiia bacterium]MCL2799658.1 hypothetical protein [Endomicrobiia bacterium]